MIIFTNGCVSTKWDYVYQGAKSEIWFGLESINNYNNNSRNEILYELALMNFTTDNEVDWAIYFNYANRSYQFSGYITNSTISEIVVLKNDITRKQPIRITMEKSADKPIMENKTKTQYEKDKQILTDLNYKISLFLIRIHNASITNCSYQRMDGISPHF